MLLLVQDISEIWRACTLPWKTGNCGSSGWNITLDSVVQYEAGECIIRCPVWNMRTPSQQWSLSYKSVQLISFKQPIVAVFCFACQDISFERRPRNRKITTSFVVSLSLSRTVIQNRLRPLSTSNLQKELPQVVSFLTSTREIHGSNLNRGINNSG